MAIKLTITKTSTYFAEKNRNPIKENIITKKTDVKIKKY